MSSSLTILICRQVHWTQRSTSKSKVWNWAICSQSVTTRTIWNLCDEARGEMEINRWIRLSAELNDGRLTTVRRLPASRAVKKMWTETRWITHNSIIGINTGWTASQPTSINSSIVTLTVSETAQLSIRQSRAYPIWETISFNSKIPIHSSTITSTDDRNFRANLQCHRITRLGKHLQAWQ